MSPPASLPQTSMDGDFVPGNGDLIEVRAGDNFQTALNRARPGDTIELQAGAFFQGPFTLPKKRGEDWITIRSSGAGLPVSGNRVSPADSIAMAKLVAAVGSVLDAAEGAHHYHFEGIEILPAVSEDGQRNALINLVTLANNPESADEMPHHFIFERCYIHGDPVVGSRRGIAMNSGFTTVKDSFLSDFKLVGQDTQAIAGWGGSGPFLIRNNYLEASGENVLFGGADPGIENLVPSDIEVSGNHFAKPVSWKMDDPAYGGTDYTVKNLFELKNARRVLIDGNLFEYNWPHAQNGFAILFTVRNQDGMSPWSTIEDVTFSNNILRHIGSGVNILGHDDIYPSGPAKRIKIENNLFEDVGGQWGHGRLFQMLDGADNVEIANNTAFNTENVIMAEGRSHSEFAFNSNIVVHNEYGIIGTDVTMGFASLVRYFPTADVSNNIMIGGEQDYYPAGNFFPSSVEDVNFNDLESNNFRISRQSRYWQEDPELRVGADIELLCRALSRTDKPEYCF